MYQTRRARNQNLTVTNLCEDSPEAPNIDLVI